MTDINTIESYDDKKNVIIEDLVKLGNANNGIINQELFESQEFFSELTEEEIEEIKQKVTELGVEILEEDDIDRENLEIEEEEEELVKHENFSHLRLFPSIIHCIGRESEETRRAEKTWAP